MEVVINGHISANGGMGDGIDFSGDGGGGSGGAIRIVATTVSGTGIVSLVAVPVMTRLVG